MDEWIYNSLFLECQNMYTLMLARARFDPFILGTDSAFFKVITDGISISTTYMYSFRTLQIIWPADLQLLSKRYPNVRFTLLYERRKANRLTDIGYGVSTDGLCEQYWGSTIGAHGSPRKPPDHHPFDRLGQHSLSLEVFVRRLRSEGIAPDDPINHPNSGDSDYLHSDDDDW